MKSLSQNALPANAAKRLLELASTIDASYDGRVYVENVNIAFLREGGSPDEYRAGIDRLKADGLIDMHRRADFSGLPRKAALRFA